MEAIGHNELYGEMIPTFAGRAGGALSIFRRGAGDETRTRDIFLGKEVLYQLSYTRASWIEEGMMRQKQLESSRFCARFSRCISVFRLKEARERIVPLMCASGRQAWRKDSRRVSSRCPEKLPG